MRGVPGLNPRGFIRVFYPGVPPADFQGVSLTLDDYEALVGALGYELHLHPELVKRVAV